MADLLGETDLVIGSGGTSTWERACLGVPAVIFSLAENQTMGAQALAVEGCHIYLGRACDVTDEILRSAVELLLKNQPLRALIAKNSFALTDGGGVRRVLGHLLSQPIELRRAVSADCNKIFNWRNHPITRQMMLNPASIELKDHCKWFESILDDSSRDLLIGMIHDVAIGVLRFDCHDRFAKISVYLDPDRHGEGFGGSLIRAGTKWLMAHRLNIVSVKAEILVSNEVSRRAFMGSGYRAIHTCFDLQLNRSISTSSHEIIN
jgi:RimJ/RimL family protein N-acetyltransferase